MGNMIMLTMSKTGHMHYNSPIESDDDCNTCDGARCGNCKDLYKVENWSTEESIYRGYDKDAALKAYYEATEKWNLDEKNQEDGTGLYVEFENDYTYVKVGNSVIACMNKDETKNMIDALENKTQGWTVCREKYTLLYLGGNKTLVNEYKVDPEKLLTGLTQKK